jgi:leucyl-tRNA synthetase
MEYNFRELEQKWQKHWNDTKAYKVSNVSDKPKYYVLDMFPYPSGAGLHVGHPLGYIASDIFARYKRLKGFNVLHPMGYDAFGLPAEQYAIEHGIHPKDSTENNINNFRKQLDKIGFCFDWDREVKTCDPKYYKWTQWIFLQLFNSYFNRKTQKAESIESLVEIFNKEGNINFPCPGDAAIEFERDDWKSYTDKYQQEILMHYRLAFCGYGEVNWCEALGTVLANDEVVNGVSERGGHPVVKKKLRQWYLRITEYADRLLEGLQTVDFSDAMKEMQTNWIGKSYGAEIDFAVKSEKKKVNSLRVYTTRPDTIFGVDFMVVAPELEIVKDLKSDAQAATVDEYLAYVKSRSDRERQAEKKITGCFTGAYAVNPFNAKPIPIWISEYVLAGYGTGAIMAVPCGDERDFKFAKHFNIPITNIIGEYFNGEEANATKEAVLENSDFLNGMVMKDAIDIVCKQIEALKIGKRKTNFKMRDAAFSRQRYWGEPFPIVWKDGVAYLLPESELPLLLPEVDSYSPGPEGEGPLANILEWVAKELETNTMPGYAGSSWYFLRYMDPENETSFCDRKVSDYWNQVDLYIGGTEHAVGHLLYSRMWTKALYDLGFIGYDEPYRKLVNQGMIVGVSEKIYLSGVSFSYLREFKKENKVFIPIGEGYEVDVYNPEEDMPIATSTIFIHQKKHNLESFFEDNFLANTSEYRVEIKDVDNHVLNVQDFLKSNRGEQFINAVFLCEGGFWFQGEFHKKREGSDKFFTEPEVEKMSKSKFNTVNPDDLVLKYGADTFRMYEMFLGPVEQSKPWDTKGIEGVHRFLKKLWRLFFDELKGKQWNEEKATEAELKVLHKAIKKIEEDTERFSFNTAVSAFMVAVNEIADAKCNKREILEPLLIMLTPYAPHIAAELWNVLGNETSVLDATYPTFNPAYLVESAKEYPISINGKLRTTITISLDATQADVEQIVLANETVAKWIEGKPVKKLIFVKNKMVNLVI